MKKTIIIFIGLILTLFISLPIEGNNKKLTDDLKQTENKIETTEDRDDVYDEEIKEELANYSYFQTGNASFYGGKWHGRKTANGEIFDTYKLTAAHKTLPFGTRVRVT